MKKMFRLFCVVLVLISTNRIVLAQSSSALAALQSNGGVTDAPLPSLNVPQPNQNDTQDVDQVKNPTYSNQNYQNKNLKSQANQEPLSRIEKIIQGLVDIDSYQVTESGKIREKENNSKSTSNNKNSVDKNNDENDNDESNENRNNNPIDISNNSQKNDPQLQQPYQDRRPQKEKLEVLHQFGYDFFKKPFNSTSTNLPVTPDYIIGPNDEITLTLWGLVEGVYNLKVSKEGNVTLPKAGVTPVTGVRFSDLEKVLRAQLEKYYKDFNLSVAIANLKTIPVYVTGEVARPGRYTISSLASLIDALIVAGGPTKQGSLRSVELKRNGESKEIDLYSFLITGNKEKDIKLEAGDSIVVPIIGPVAAVSGNVYKPGIYETKEGESIGDALNFAGGILPVGSLHRIQVQRVESNQKRVIMDVQATPDMLRSKRSLAFAVSNMDIVRIMPIYSEIWNKISLVGTVQRPGDYELKPAMHLKDILNRDQLTPDTYLGRVEIVRTDSKTLERQILAVNLKKLLDGDKSENILLKGRDVIYVFTEERGEFKVTLKGEVRRPGEYIAKRGEKLSSLLKRAGGFTEEAYPKGITFTRQSVMDQQRIGMDKSLQQLELNLARREADRLPGLSQETASIQSAESTNLKNLLEKLRQAKPEGRIILNLNPDLEEFENSPDNITLNDGDYIEIPQRPSTIMVLGSVINPSAITWKKDATLKDYLREVGGPTKYASKREIYVFKMNGKVLSSRYYALGSLRLEPGDIINVPDKLRKPGQALFTLKDLTQIVFNLGTTAALFLAAF